jgi:membrane fusion protein, multidrug efflux system
VAENPHNLAKPDSATTTTTGAPPTPAPTGNRVTHSTPEEPPRKRSHAWVWIVLLVIAGLVGFRVYQNKQAEAQAAKAKAAAANRGVPITTTTATQGSIGVYISALGTVTSVYTATITSRVDGQIISVNYREGQMVHKGDVLIQIDPRPYAAALTQAEGTLAHDEALLAEARIDLNRYQEAFNRNAIAKQQLDDQTQTVKQYEGSVKNDQGTVASATTNVDYATIRAPIDGRVGLRLVDPGNIVTAGSTTALVVIAQLQPITVIFSVAEDYLPQIQKQMKAGHKMSVTALDRDQQTQLATGSLLTLDNQIDTSTGTVKLKAIFENGDLALFPNQFVNAKLLVDTQQDATLIQTAAIQRNASSAFVYLIKPDPTKTDQPATDQQTGKQGGGQGGGGQAGTATLQAVTVGTTDGNISAVQGLKPGDVVALTGFDKLQDGAKVTVRNGQGGANGSKTGGAQAGSTNGSGSGSGSNSGGGSGQIGSGGQR